MESLGFFHTTRCQYLISYCEGKALSISTPSGFNFVLSFHSIFLNSVKISSGIFLSVTSCICAKFTIFSQSLDAKSSTHNSLGVLVYDFRKNV